MSWIETLKVWDTDLFLSINGIHSPFFDGVMYAISAKFTWVFLYLSVIYAVIKRWKRESIWIVIALVFCIIIADQVSSTFIKEWVQRPRPSHAEALQGLVHNVRDYTGGAFGFVSSHAANSIGFALLSSMLFRRKGYTLAIFAWAILTGYSRIYLGVHYPGDVLGGSLVGILAALLCFWCIKKLRPSLLVEVHGNDFSREYFRVWVPLWALGLSFVGILIYSLAIL